jgi:hypothetical protein
MLVFAAGISCARTASSGAICTDDMNHRGSWAHQFEFLVLRQIPQVDSFTYVPGDIIVPGILEAGDIGDVVGLARRARRVSRAWWTGEIAGFRVKAVPST